MKMQKRLQWLAIFTILTVFSGHVIYGIADHASAALFNGSVISQPLNIDPSAIRLRLPVPGPSQDRLDRLRDALLLLIRPSVS